MTIHVTPIPSTLELAAPSFTLTTANAAGAAGTAIASDSELLVFDATLPDSIAYSQSGSAGAATVAARRDHAHAMAAGADFWDLIEAFVETEGRKVLFSLGGAHSQPLVSNDQVGLGFDVEWGNTGSLAASTNIRGAWRLSHSTDGSMTMVATAYVQQAADDWIVEARLAVGQTTSQDFFVGFSESDTGGNPPGIWHNEIGCRVYNDGNYVFFVDNAGTETLRDTGTAVDTSEHTFRIEISDDGDTVTMFFDDSQVGLPITSNIPTSTAMAILVSISPNSAAEKVVDVSDFWASREV